jgi:radical SAM protein with 4Fe4S-binding SPASM domain
VAVRSALDFFLQLHVTSRCNLRCRHCYQTGTPADELGRGEIRELLAEVREMLGAWEEAYEVSFSPSLNLTGGEPLLRADCCGIVEDAARAGFGVALLTNGTLVDREAAGRLADLGVRVVQVSVEGEEAVHDRLRGRGSFAAALAGVDALVAAGVRVTANMTLSRVNAGSVFTLARLAADRGVQCLGFSRMVPAGRGCELRDEELAAAEVARLYREIAATPVPGIAFVTGDPVASCLLWPPEVDPGLAVPVGGCAAGLSGVTILEDGTILPCRRLALPLGNIRRDSLREVWATSPVLASLRDRASYRGKCGACPRWAACRGCRAIAWAHSLREGAGDLGADDPQCFLGGGPAGA